MRTLNTTQAQKGRAKHVCPFQLDIVERLITRYSNEGDLVFDPFGGIQSVPYCAINLGRRGLSTELNKDYWRDGLSYLREAEMQVTKPHAVRCTIYRPTRMNIADLTTDERRVHQLTAMNRAKEALAEAQHAPK